MREILFRGKTENKKKWVYGAYIKDESPDSDGIVLIVDKSKYYVFKQNYLETECVDIVIPETVGQYTGLTDKNGKKIFEGDIVIEEFGAIKTGVVTFGNHGVIDEVNPDSVGFYVKWIDDYDLRSGLYYWHDKVEIVGNIHDTPELLKEVQS